MKYIDAEKLKAEIERYKQGAAIARFDNGGEYADYFQGKVDLCDDLPHIIDFLQQEQPESTCKTCGFYEKNCPFIRGKLIPYPNKVCKDYIHSAMKEQEQLEVDLEEEIEKFCLEYDARKEVWFDMTSRDQKMLSTPTWSNFAANIARHFYELGLKARKEE